MVPFLWGPMTWRQIHGMAHIFDTRIDDDITEKTAEVFVLFLIALAWVLPCSTCREGYTNFLLAALKRDLLQEVFAPRAVRRFAFDLHNLVNVKLGRPECESFELVQRRSEVWSVEFLPRELFGLLFIIALNFRANQEPDKEQHYREFFSVLPTLLDALGHMRMAAALGEMISSLPDTAWTQPVLLRALYNAFAEWQTGPVPDFKEIVETYTLCRAE